MLSTAREEDNNMSAELGSCLPVIATVVTGPCLLRSLLTSSPYVVRSRLIPSTRRTPSGPAKREGYARAGRERRGW